MLGKGQLCSAEARMLHRDKGLGHVATDLQVTDQVALRGSREAENQRLGIEKVSEDFYSEILQGHVMFTSVLSSKHFPNDSCHGAPASQDGQINTTYLYWVKFI